MEILRNYEKAHDPNHTTSSVKYGGGSVMGHVCLLLEQANYHYW